jgi:hypothetical protein
MIYKKYILCISLVIGIMMIFSSCSKYSFNETKILIPINSSIEFNKESICYYDSNEIIIGGSEQKNDESIEAKIIYSINNGKEWNSIGFGRGSVDYITSIDKFILLLINEKNSGNKFISRVVKFNISNKNYEIISNFNFPIKKIMTDGLNGFVMFAYKDQISTNKNLLYSIDNGKSWQEIKDVNDYISDVLFNEQVDINESGKILFFSKNHLYNYDIHKKKITKINNNPINVRAINHKGKIFYAVVSNNNPYILKIENNVSKEIRIDLNEKWDVSDYFYIYHNFYCLLISKKNTSILGNDYAFFISDDNGNKWNIYKFAGSIKAKPLTIYMNKTIVINDLGNKIRLLRIDK